MRVLFVGRQLGGLQRCLRMVFCQQSAREEWKSWDGGLRSDRRPNERLPCLASLSQSRQRLSGSSMYVSGWQCPRRAGLRLARTLQLATLFFMLVALLLPPWRLG
jgi:hypothetical protein